MDIILSRDHPLQFPLVRVQHSVFEVFTILIFKIFKNMICQFYGLTCISMKEWTSWHQL